jgi:adenosine deaminase
MNAADLMLRKRDIVATTATRGWFFIAERAETIIKQLTNEAIDCENKEDSGRLVTEARAARKFWKQLTQALEASKQVEVESETDSDSNWYDVAN